jgi:hypothetical protein
LLQFKEAYTSVLEPYAGKSRYDNHAQRVAMEQRLMQASSDILLGWPRAIGDFALVYAAQTQRDHAALVEAVNSGRIKAIIEEDE